MTDYLADTNLGRGNTDGYIHSFTDVASHWADPELGWSSNVGLINGVGDKKFSPDTELTTEQAIAITYRAYVRSNNGDLITETETMDTEHFD